MTKVLLVQILILGSLPVFAGQGLTVKPSLDPKERWEEFDRATADWRAVSRNLEKEFLRQTPAKVLPWIDRASAKAAAMVEARDAFYQVIADQIRSHISLLHNSPGPRLAELRRTNSQTLARLAEDRRRLTESKVRDDGRPETTLLNEQTDSQLLTVRQLEDNLRDQAAKFDAVEVEAGSLSDAKATLLRSLEEALRLIEKQAEQDRGEASLWQSYYGSLKELVEARLTESSSRTPDAGKPRKK